MRSQKTSSGRPKKNASATAARNAQKCAGQSERNKKKQVEKKKQTLKNTNKTNSRKKQVSGKKDSERINNSEATCGIDKKCGGCQFQKLPYKEQLKRKQKQEEKLLGSFCKVSPIIGMENPYFYRNKVHAVFDRDRKGNIISGIYAEGTHRVIAVEECLIEDKKSQEIIRTIRELLPSFKIKTYNEDTGYGLLRHVLIRRGFETGEIMVVLVLGSPILPSKNNFVKALRKVHPEITTVVLNVNNKQTSMYWAIKRSQSTDQASSKTICAAVHSAFHQNPSIR